jgi:solute carrier family 34 (sodium-dependent phosphate cotransporter)
VALVHVLFNVIGTLIWYPLRRVPYGVANWYGRMAGRSVRYALLFLFLIFLILPVIGITVTELFIVYG